MQLPGNKLVCGKNCFKSYSRLPGNWDVSIEWIFRQAHPKLRTINDCRPVLDYNVSFWKYPSQNCACTLCTLIKSVLVLLQISSPQVFPVISKPISEYWKKIMGREVCATHTATVINGRRHHRPSVLTQVVDFWRWKLFLRFKFTSFKTYVDKEKWTSENSTV